jgi:aminoglycoside phosphotransferase (APT) family kinase protein
MPKADTEHTTTRRTKRKTAPPPLPPKSDDEQRALEAIASTLRELAKVQQQRNLDAAVRLAVEAAAGHGELVERFAELGRRFGDFRLTKQYPQFSVIEGSLP